jgi:hypothetical protein
MCINTYLFYSRAEHLKSTICACPPRILDYLINNWSLVPTYLFSWAEHLKSTVCARFQNILDQQIKMFIYLFIRAEQYRTSSIIK